jgi:hypothetical protein
MKIYGKLLTFGPIFFIKENSKIVKISGSQNLLEAKMAKIAKIVEFKGDFT